MSREGMKLTKLSFKNLPITRFEGEPSGFDGLRMNVRRLFFNLSLSLAGPGSSLRTHGDF
jgi:hypothetical protein